MMLDDIARTLTARIQQGASPIGVSRVELMQGSDDKALYVLFRTRDELTERMLRTPYCQYPWEMLANAKFIYTMSSDYLDAGEITLSMNELLVAARLNERTKDWAGASFLNTGYFRVPEVPLSPITEQEDISYGSPQYWTLLLLEDALASQYNLGDKPQLFVVHLPDTAIDAFSEEQLAQFNTLSMGWNYLRASQGIGHGDIVAISIDVMTTLAECAEPIRFYNS
jgi:hypothetical protein